MRTRPLILVMAVIVLQALAGCGDKAQADIPIGYGERGSINGFSVFRALVREHYGAQRAAGTGDHLDDTDLVFHLHNASGFRRSLDETLRWAADWVQGVETRQVVVIARDGDVTAPLAERWRQEADQAYRTSLAEQQDELAERFRLSAVYFARLALRAEGARLGPGVGAEVIGLDWEGLAPHWPERVIGRGAFPAESPAPATLRVAADVELVDPYLTVRRPGVAARDPVRIDGKRDGHLGLSPTEPEYDEWEDWEDDVVDPEPELMDVWLADDRGVPLVFACTYDGGRVIVVTTATWLTDGALVDPVARQLAEALIDATDTGADQRAMFIRSVSVSIEDYQPTPTFVSMLTHFPFGVIGLHALVLVVLYLLAKRLWLGRREAPEDHEHERFLRHLEALGQLLAERETSGRGEVVNALARWHGRKHPNVHSDDAALTAISTWFGPDDADQPPESSPDSSVSDSSHGKDHT